MKKIGIAIISIVSLLVISSCSTKHNGPILSATPGSPSINAPKDGQTYTLDKKKAQDTLFTMKWSTPDYGFPAAVTYNVQLSKQGGNFANPIKVGSAHQPSFSATEKSINSVLLGAGYVPNQPATFQLRVVASLSDSVKNQVSKPINMVVTPYSNYTYIYVPGGYQSASDEGNDWDPGTAPPLAMVGNKVYSGYVYIIPDGSQFKFTNDQTWTLNWGMGASQGTLVQNGGNITIPQKGYYLINVDLNQMTYKLTKTDWSVIGDAAKGWSTDVPMSYDPQSKLWTVTLNLSKGSFKFRANDSWNLNYGDGGNGRLAENGNNNISVSAPGKYKIEMDLSNPPLYTYKLIKQ
ncbi:MAG TPA: SusE domain-containing protein [Balneolales bacterium]|nr:SusE domain-containing protein [Balneolales bacterium]